MKFQKWVVNNNIFNDKANYERKPLEEMHALAEEEEEINDEGVDDKDHPIAGAIGLRDQLIGGEPSKLDTVSGITTEDLEAELEMDLDNLKLDDIDTTDVNLDDEELLED